MNIQRKFMIGATALAGAATLGIGLTQASTLKTSGFNPMGNLVSAIAQKFNLNKSDVQQVFDEQRTLQEQQMQAERAAREKAMLDQAVKDGKLTQAQEDLIIAKQAEAKTFLDGLKNLGATERQAKLETWRTELKAWAATNSIPEQYLMPVMGGPGKGRGGMGPGRMGDSRARLDQAVVDGKLTQAQADQIAVKHAEYKTAVEALKDKTAAERQAAIKTLDEGLKTWAKANNIPEQYVMPLGRGLGEGRGQGLGGRGGMMGWGQKGNQAQN